MNGDSLLNAARPPVFCPGCSHERVVHALDKTLRRMGIKGEQIVLVSDIGCSGLFDTFFNTHALHGLHGRALTYATGIKMARPDLHVIVTMGDGGLGIGAAHVLSTCRRNIDLTLLVLNNFNYGMTGGQCSSTTPMEARVSSGFLNRLEKPLDVCQMFGTAGAAWVDRTSVYDEDLVDKMEEAVRFTGFSILDIWGLCPGRYVKTNKVTPSTLREEMKQLPSWKHFSQLNRRPEYASHYREEASRCSQPQEPLRVERICDPPEMKRQEIVLLGAAGQRILTAGELLCLAGMTAGMHATQKNDYPITVMRGHSITEVILNPEPVDFTGIESPDVVIALAEDGVKRWRSAFSRLSDRCLVLRTKGLAIPETAATPVDLDFRERKLKSGDWALASLAWLASKGVVITRPMLHKALELRFSGSALEDAMKILDAWE
ncbi:MAG: thiamine pyrophosphate-dependent enzyme [Desulfosoma sp.]